MTLPVLSAHQVDNAAMISEVLRLYPPAGGVIADVTYGKGLFWRKTDLAGITLLKSDLEPRAADVLGADFRELPYEAGSVDLVVLDPPYLHNPGRHSHDHPATERYNNASTRGMRAPEIIALYRAGMEEAQRVLRGPGSQLWVKCKDQVDSHHRQNWAHIELYEVAVELGFYPRDLFVLVPSDRMSFARWTSQHHARKVHSYLWVFEVPGRRLRTGPAGVSATSAP